MNLCTPFEEKRLLLFSSAVVPLGAKQITTQADCWGNVSSLHVLREEAPEVQGKNVFFFFRR